MKKILLLLFIILLSMFILFYDPFKTNYPSEISIKGDNVYFSNQIITGADPKTIQKIPYFEKNIFQNLDKVSKYYPKETYGNIVVSFPFVFSESFFGKRLSLYQRLYLAINPSKKTFNKLSKYLFQYKPVFFKDKNNIYYALKPIEGVDVESFYPLEFSYAIDKDHVYYQGKKLEGIDVNTFELYKMNPFYFLDKNGKYKVSEGGSDFKLKKINEDIKESRVNEKEYESKNIGNTIKDNL